MADYCVERNRLLVGLQEDGRTPGMKISQLAYDLLNLGFDDAVFLRGSALSVEEEGTPVAGAFGCS